MKSIMAVAILCVSVFPGAAGEANKLSETRSTLEKWVEARQLISKTRVDWQADKETIEQTTRMIERELKDVEEKFAKLSTNSAQVDKERSEAEASNQSSNEAIAPAQQFATEFEGKIRSLVPRLSEAFIATASGMVAIPALLLHAFLSRKAKDIIGGMEQTAVGFINGVPNKEKNPFEEKIFA